MDQNELSAKNLSRWQNLQATWERWAQRDLPLRWPLVLLLGGVAFWLVSRVGIREDWHVTFYPAGQNWLDPYENSFHLVYPPWLAMILAPFTLFPEDVARGLFAAFSVGLTAVGVRQLGGGFASLLLVLLTPFYVTLLVRGETDALPVAGLGLIMLEPVGWQVVGLALLALKPQTMGFAAAFLALFTLQTAYTQGQYTRLRQLVLGFGAILLISFLLYGAWPLDILERLPDLYRVDDVSSWPYGLPVGLFLLWHAYRRRSLAWAALATYFFVPYVNWYSLAGYAVIIFSRSPKWFAAALLILSWVWFLNYTT